MSEAEEDNLVRHAIRELELLGQTQEDPEFASALIEAVRAFSTYGHSGGSAMAGISMLHQLLQFKALAPLTTDPAEWMDVAEQSGIPLWQSRRQSDAFCEGMSPDHPGATFYHLDGGSGRVPMAVSEEGTLYDEPQPQPEPESEAALASPARVSVPGSMHAVEIAASVCVGQPEMLIPTARQIVNYVAMGVGVPMSGFELQRRLELGEHWDVQYLTGDDAAFFPADQVNDEFPMGMPPEWWGETFGQICLVVREA